MSDDAEFFIGWQGRAPPQTGRKLVQITFIVGLFTVIAAAAFAVLQRTIGRATWDYNNEREFTGRLHAAPAPTLIVDDGTTFLLVNPNKFGFDPAVARNWDGQAIRLRATLLQRDGHAMLDVAPGSITRVTIASAPANEAPIADLGEHALRGEIVDSKCFLGAMNPGVLKPHRACAIRCISGGVPPILLVRDESGAPVYYLLVGADGESIGRDVLDFVAEPVEIRGRVQRHGEQLVLRANSGAIQRLP